MRREFATTRLAALAAVVLLLVAAPACNETDEPENAEAVILVTGIATAGLSVASGIDTTATITFMINPRNAGATTFFHDVTMTSYEVGFEPAVVASGTGVIATGFCQVTSSCDVTLILVPNGAKPGAGTTVIARVSVNGEDINDNPVNFQATIPLTFLP